MHRQAVIGLIGGLSWESSAQYYRIINRGGFRAKVQRAYKKARQAKLWENTYSMNNRMTNDPVKYAEEYWAEGVESYFDANLFADPPHDNHNAINTRAKLKAYDGPLYKLIDAAFHGTPWRPHCP